MKTRNRSENGTQAEMFLTIVENVIPEHGLRPVLDDLADNAEKYTVDKSADGVYITALFPDASFISVTLDDAGYVERTIIQH